MVVAKVTPKKTNAPKYPFSCFVSKLGLLLNLSSN
jgi:hypothetical protein